jgi:serine/threonine protein kinase/tetratricopeptide (TPR) repeat protein
MMSNERRDPESIFHEARQIGDPGARSDFLHRACSPDVVLRQRVERLLQADSDAGSFLQTPATSSTAETLDHRHSHDQTTPLYSRAAGEAIAERPGTVIGRYKLLQQIGEGGFGLVFLAEQEKPVRRKVALKIIKLGMDTRQVIARFEAERQALALMDHPHVAKVLDAGATEAGRPYFVMEFVEGVAITKYCDRHELSLRDRLDLFIQVCAAVQHAHQKGIIHRDIKPSNVLVAQRDGKPVPKVIDFGIAKATEQKLTERTMFTEFGQFLGTPAYMSPEQAEMSSEDVDTRSDIYSLGVLLYELLTGTTPFDIKTLRSAGITEIQRMIREDEPHRPSTRMTTLGDALAVVAKLRKTDAKRIKTTLRGDLDWIIMKALDKDRGRRYDSAADFARDLERYLNHEPVTAGPPSVSYRLQKFIRRNRTGVAVGAIAAIALIGFAATMTVQAERIATERDRANHEREMSDRVVQFQTNMLQRIKPLKLGEGVAADLRNRLEAALSDKGQPEDQREASLTSLDGLLSEVNLTDTARTILDANILAPAVTTVEDEFADQPLVEARLLEALGRTYMALGLNDQALTRVERSLDLRRKHLPPDHRDTLRTIVLHAMVLWELGRSNESGDMLQKTIATYEKEFGPEDPGTLFAKGCLAARDVDRGLGAKARKQYEDLIKVQERVLGPEHEDVASTLLNLGILLINQHHDDDAVPVLERAFNIFSKESPDDHGRLKAMQNLAKAYQALQRTDEAAKLQAEAMERLERTRGARHPDTVEAVGNLADLYKAQGDYQKAEPIAKKALELHRAVFGDAHRKTIKTITDVGIILGMLGRHAEAEKYHVEAYERAKAAFGATSRDALEDLNNLAVHYWYLGEYQKALEAFTECLTGMEQRHGKDHVQTTHAMLNLAIIYTKLGRVDESQSMLESALAIRTKTYGLDHPETLLVRGSIAFLSYEKGDWSRAEQQYSELLPAEKKALGPDHPLVLESTYNLAIVREQLGRKDEAIELFATALEGRRRAVGPTHSEALDAATELARMQHEAGKTEEARKLLVEVIAARKAAASTEGASPAQLHAYARVLVRCPIEDLGNLADALKYAEQAAAATGYADPQYLSTLARALFESGDGPKAAESQRKAISLLPEASPARAKYEEALAEYLAADSS